MRRPLGFKFKKTGDRDGGCCSLWRFVRLLYAGGDTGTVGTDRQTSDRLVCGFYSFFRRHQTSFLNFFLNFNSTFSVGNHLPLSFVRSCSSKASFVSCFLLACFVILKAQWIQMKDTYLSLLSQICQPVGGQNVAWRKEGVGIHQNLFTLRFKGGDV